MDMITGIAAGVFLAALVFFFLYLRFFRQNAVEEQEPAVPSLPADIPSYTPLDGTRGNARTCPLCAARFEFGELVKTKAFPSTGRSGRLLHMLGCKFCLSGERERKCPVCDAVLPVDEYLIARFFERPGKSHVHVQGCPHCLGKH
ncbi:MAG: hypothetical protein LBG74_05470 [Spirochaetaceae bacterium]|jgi:hypothetical protein|nr:hypothetical protein [Spirochaetaceae bacterium]